MISNQIVCSSGNNIEEYGRYINISFCHFGASNLHVCGELSWTEGY